MLNWRQALISNPQCSSCHTAQYFCMNFEHLLCKLVCGSIELLNNIVLLGYIALKVSPVGSIRLTNLVGHEYLGMILYSIDLRVKVLQEDIRRVKFNCQAVPNLHLPKFVILLRTQLYFENDTSIFSTYVRVKNRLATLTYLLIYAKMV